MQDNTWSFAADVSRVYGYGLATESDTLTLEVYFIDSRPRLMLEFFHRNHAGESRKLCKTSTASLACVRV